MPNLILVKHAQPDIDPLTDARNWHLSAAGQSSCVPLAARLATYHPTVVISSDEPKAVETAQIVAARLNIPTRVASGLHEHDRQGMGLLPRTQFEAAIKLFFTKPDELVYGNETATQARTRFSAAVVQVLADHPNTDVAIVAHGTVISLFVAEATSIDPLGLWRRLGLPSFVALLLPKYDLIEVIDGIE